MALTDIWKRLRDSTDLDEKLIDYRKQVKARKQTSRDITRDFWKKGASNIRGNVRMATSPDTRQDYFKGLLSTQAKPSTQRKVQQFFKTPIKAPLKKPVESFARLTQEVEKSPAGIPKRWIESRLVDPFVKDTPKNLSTMLDPKASKLSRGLSGLSTVASLPIPALIGVEDIGMSLYDWNKAQRAKKFGSTKSPTKAFTGEEFVGLGESLAPEGVTRDVLNLAELPLMVGGMAFAGRNRAKSMAILQDEKTLNRVLHYVKNWDIQKTPEAGIKQFDEIVTLAKKHAPELLKSNQMRQLEKTDMTRWVKLLGQNLGDKLYYAKNPQEAIKAGLGVRESQGAKLVQPDIIEKAKLKIGESTKKIDKGSWDKFYTNWVNRFHPVEKLTKGIEKELGVSVIPKDSPIFKLKRLLGSGGTAELRHKKQLDPIIKQLDDIPLNDFDLFMKAQRDIELAGRGIVGSDVKEANSVIRALSGKYDVNKMNKVANELYSYQSKNLDMLKESGFLNEAGVANIKAVNQKYVPFERVMDDVDNYLGVPSVRAQQATQPIKGIKGSEKAILPPLESIIANTYKTQAAVDKNNVAKSITGLRNIDPKYQDLFTQVGKAGDDTLTVWENGRKMFYKAPQDIVEVVKGLNEDSSGTLVEILSAPARVLRQQATGRNVEFMIPNVVRDQLDAAVNSKYGYKPFIDYIDGLAHLVRSKWGGGDDLVEQWMASGGKMSFENLAGRKSIKKEIEAATTQKGAIKQLKEWLIGGVETVGELSETPTRIGLFKRALKKTDNIDIAMRESREATLDFARMGAKMKVYNAIIPFLNVGVQGFDRMVRTAKARPGQFALAITAYGALPQTLASIYNNVFHGEDYAQVPDWVKEGNFVIMKDTKDREGNPEYLTIPKGHAARLAANPTDNFITYLAGSNPQSFGQLATSMISEVAPVIAGGSTPGEIITRTVGANIPQAVRPIIEDISNKSFFKGQDIVPAYLKSKEPYKQDFKTTPVLYKKLGALVNMSPLRVKNVLEGYLSSGIKIPANTLEVLTDISEGKEPNPNQVPVLRRFLGSYEGFDIDRTEKKEKTSLSERLGIVSKAKASEEGTLPTNTKQLKVLYEDATSTMNRYAKNKTKAQYGLVDRDLSEYQEEFDKASTLLKQIKSEQPEKIFEIESEVFSKDGGQDTDDRVEWATSTLKDLEGDEYKTMYKKLVDKGVITKAIAEALKEAGLDANEYSYGSGSRFLSTGGTKSAKKITIKKPTIKATPKTQAAFTGISTQPARLNLKSAPIKIGTPKVAKLVY